MIRRPPRTTLPYTLLPYTPLFRARDGAAWRGGGAAGPPGAAGHAPLCGRYRAARRTSRRRAPRRHGDTHQPRRPEPRAPRWQRRSAADAGWRGGDGDAAARRLRFTHPAGAPPAPLALP